MDKDLVAQIGDVAKRVVASGAISANGHGNVSLRAPGSDEIYFTGGATLRDHPASAVARVRLNGDLIEGSLPPIQGAVVAMHTAMYADHPEVGCVIHTHSPCATAYAVARRPIGCWTEALAMFGLSKGVPVAAYGPAALTKLWLTSVLLPRKVFPPFCSQIMGYWSSIALRSLPSSSVGSSRKPLRPVSMPPASADHSRSPPNSGPRPCREQWLSRLAGFCRPDKWWLAPVPR